LKDDVRTRHIPVLALTSHAMEGFSEGARAAGCDGFVTKPCLPEQLVAEIRAMLDKARRPKSRSGT
jgi:CheY-like chemotaxis protein